MARRGSSLALTTPRTPTFGLWQAGGRVSFSCGGFVMATRILVIEDNPESLELMTYLLRAYGYATLSAADGEEGLKTVKNQVPDLVLCDLQMPAMDGYELART